MSFFIEESVPIFLIMTVIIGGGLAFLAGRGLASKWRPMWMAIAYMIPMGLALRFFHYALFESELLTLHYFLVDTAVLIIGTVLGYRITRVQQMVNQYPWLYESAGPFGWKQRQSG